MDPNEPYPCLIVMTRYSKAYEGGPWAAFQVQPSDLVGEDWDADDTPAMRWWEKHRSGVGVGDSPQAAYDALLAIPRQLRWRGKPPWKG